MASVRLRHLASVRAGDRGKGCRREVGAKGADCLPDGRLPQQPVRASAAECDGAGLGRAIAVAAGSVGVLGRHASMGA